MNTDKRQVTTDALETLGTIITDAEKRDAIHLAVEPVIAAEDLFPGQNVGFTDSGVGRCANPVGIVDPFLKETVRKGERFWMVVYPRQITSLRHVWEHPAFPPSTDTKATIDESALWIRNFAASVLLPYDTIMEGACRWLEDKREGGWGEYLCDGGLLEGKEVPQEFWDHYEIVTGEKVAEKHRGSFFTCSC